MNLLETLSRLWQGTLGPQAPEVLNPYQAQDRELEQLMLAANQPSVLPIPAAGLVPQRHVQTLPGAPGVLQTLEAPWGQWSTAGEPGPWRAMPVYNDNGGSVSFGAGLFGHSLPPVGPWTMKNMHDSAVTRPHYMTRQPRRMLPTGDQDNRTNPLLRPRTENTEELPIQLVMNDNAGQRNQMTREEEILRMLSQYSTGGVKIQPGPNALFTLPELRKPIMPMNDPYWPGR